jgi:hypothetical protein
MCLGIRVKKAGGIVCSVVLLVSILTLLDPLTVFSIKDAEADQSSTAGSDEEETADRDERRDQARDHDSFQVEQFDGFPDGTVWQLLTNPQNVCLLSPSINPDLVTIPDAVLGCLAPANSGTRAWWFGVNPLGSYIGESTQFPQVPKNGGTSASPDIFGDLESPPILPPTEGNSSLMFSTWWEIESVDAHAFDLMLILAVLNDLSVVEVTRLNPSTDAAWGTPDLHYASDYSGLGQNAVEQDPFLAPQWVNHMVPLPEGTIEVIFRFSNNDALYNGFRGWMLDDIKVLDAQNNTRISDDFEQGPGGWTPDPSIPREVDLHINKFEDLDGDGLKGPDEPSLPGWRFIVTDLNRQVICDMITMNDDESTQDVDETGFIWCKDIDTQSHPPPFTITEELKPGFGNITPNPLLVTPFVPILNIEFANFRPAEIHGMKWDDLNGNGIKDIIEPGIPFVPIQLFRLFPPNNIGFLVNITLTDLDGNYWFTDLPPGSYRVKEITPQGRIQTFPPFGIPWIVQLNASQILNNVDFGNQEAPPAEIHGMKFLDSNNNGVKDMDEPGIPDVLVCLLDSLFFTVLDCLFTDSNGNYWFTNLPPGTYVVSEFIPPTLTNTTPPDQIVTLVLGQNKSGLNFGNAPLLPPPLEVNVIGDTGQTFNGLPVIFWGSSTTYTKNVSQHCGGIMPAQVKLVIEMPETNGMFMQFMTKLVDNPLTPEDESQIWTATFPPFFPHHGPAILTFYVDCPPDTNGFPEDPGLKGQEDEIQMGGNIYIDPSGTIVDACSGEPLAGATVTLFKESPPGSGNFLIPLTADHIPATNPQTTGTDGAYGWVVIPGVWKVVAALANFNTNESAPLSIPPAVTNLTISLEPVNGCPVGVLKGDVDLLGDGTKLGDIILTIDFFLERKTPTNEQLLAADLEPHIDGQQACGDGQIKLGDITTLIDIFLERKTVAQVCG